MNVRKGSWLRYLASVLPLIAFIVVGSWRLLSRVDVGRYKGEPTSKLTLITQFSPSDTFVVEQVEQQLLYDLPIRRVVVRRERDNGKLSVFVVPPKEVKIGQKVKILELIYIVSSSGVDNRFLMVDRVE